MKKPVKRVLLAVFLMAVVSSMAFYGCGSSSSSSSPAPAPTPTTYSGTLYMASEGGGHIGVFPVTIDPSNTASPITVDTAAQSKIQLKGLPGATNAVVFHDLRFDNAANPTKIYYAAIMSEPTNTGVADIGYVDLTKPVTSTNNGINSVIDINSAAADSIAGALQAMGVGSGMRILYCASGMDTTNGYYFAMSMSLPAYLDAIPVSALANGAQGSSVTSPTTNHITSSTTGFHRTPISAIFGTETAGAHVDAFIHGAASPDGKTIYAVTNVVSGLSTTNNLLGVFRAKTIKASDLESGAAAPTIISSASYTVAPSLASIAYRASYTPDAKYILQAGSDRVLILNANDLSLYVDTAATNSTDTYKLGSGAAGGVDLHDAIATPDGKYAILSMRYYSDTTQKNAGILTSGVQLYDINNRKFVGNVVPTCGSSATQCHPATLDGMSRPTCAVLFK